MEFTKAQYEAPEIVEIGDAVDLIHGDGNSIYREGDGSYAWDTGHPPMPPVY
jgi:hypothetical protein